MNNSRHDVDNSIPNHLWGRAQIKSQLSQLIGGGNFSKVLLQWTFSKCWLYDDDDGDGGHIVFFGLYFFFISLYTFTSDSHKNVFFFVTCDWLSERTKEK